ncbi:MAG: GTP-dependent dephospho-CoA kinase family protein [Candidatus Bathyarchaeota archaeon]|nr:GTP-dependent dephospho-CoA kinase family protein [Candidatus Termiticorpusculum sp.]
MSVIYTITPELRVKFKEPFGLLIKGSFKQTMAKMREIKIQNPPKIIAVGDTVTKNLQTYDIPFDLSIIDNQCMRKKVQSVVYTLNTVNVKNPQGTITKEAIEAIEEALKKDEPMSIVVEGEEDLLALIVVLYAPENSVVVYGQPHEGIVLVKVSPEKKTEASEFLKAMEKGSKS